MSENVLEAAKSGHEPDQHQELLLISAREKDTKKMLVTQLR
jgi:hypothetical protein